MVGYRGAVTVRVRATQLLDPEPWAHRYTVISLDDHLVELSDLFGCRLPVEARERGPRVVAPCGDPEMWQFEGSQCPQVGLGALVGRPIVAGGEVTENRPRTVPRVGQDTETVPVPGN